MSALGFGMSGARRVIFASAQSDQSDLSARSRVLAPVVLIQ